MDSLPKIAIVGRPNVGKSTLFNRLVGFRQAIVDDIPGVTRDRQYGQSDWEGRLFTVIDTGGFLADANPESLESAVKDQALTAVEEADIIVFVVDGRSGLLPAEEALARHLRKQSKPVFLAVNKIDSEREEKHAAEFFRLGFANTVPISSETSRGISDLLDGILNELKAFPVTKPQATDLKLAIVGRPNVGKSTLLNALLGEDRAVVHSVAGTTRDPLNIFLTRGTRVFEFVDTAGVKRHAQTKGKLEKVSVLKTFKTIDKSHLVLAVIDAAEGMTSQDAKVLTHAVEKGKGVLLILNKWDLVPTGTTLKDYKEALHRDFKRLDYVPMIAVSAKTKRNIPNLLKLIDRVQMNFLRRVGTGELNRVFQAAVQANPPPLQSGQTVNLSYITQSGWAPPTFLIFCNRPKLVKETYLRYLERKIRKNFDFEGATIRWVMRQKR